MSKQHRYRPRVCGNWFTNHILAHRAKVHRLDKQQRARDAEFRGRGGSPELAKAMYAAVITAWDEQE